MDDATALKRLHLLLKEKGALRIIDHFHACAPTDAAIVPAGITDGMVAQSGPHSDLARRCAAYAEEHGHAAGLPGGYRDVGHYLLHDVKRIEKVRDDWWTAYADNDLGTTCSGSPSALLARLTEHERT